MKVNKKRFKKQIQIWRVNLYYKKKYSEKTNQQSSNNPAGVDHLHVTPKEALAVTDWAAEVWLVFEISSCPSHQNSFLL